MNRLSLLCLLFTASTCSVYTPTFRDCSLHCSETGTCPAGTTCNENFCRPTGFSGACDCTVGSSETCGGTRGECKSGLRLCLDSRIWGPCIGEVKPTAEICDGKDNDCDGATDEAVSGAPTCSRTQGVCLGITQACVDGGYVATCPDSAYGPDFEPLEQSCDGLDNDCDGSADSRPATRLATGVNLWTVEAVPNGYFLFSANTGSPTIAVQQFDEAFKSVGAAGSIDVGVGMASFDVHASNGGTVAIGFVRTDDTVGVIRVTTTAPEPVLLEPIALTPPKTWALSVLDSGRVRGAFESGGSIVLASWAPGGTTVTVTPYSVRSPIDTLSLVNLTNDGTVLVWSGTFDPRDGGSTSTGGVEMLDGGRAIQNSGRASYTLVPTTGRLQAFRTFSNYFAFFPVSLDESGATYCGDVWQPSLDCATVARVPDHQLIRDGTATRLQDDMAVGWVDNGTLHVATGLPTVQQVRERPFPALGVIADYALAATPTSTLLGVFYRSQAEPTNVYGMLICAP